VAISFIGGNWSIQRNHRPVEVTRKLVSHNVVTSPWTGFELTILVMIGTDCTGSCKSNHHTITTTTAPYIKILILFPYIFNLLAKKYHILRSMDFDHSKLSSYDGVVSKECWWHWPMLVIDLFYYYLAFIYFKLLKSKCH
jgi:hypothetical protein